MKLAKVLWDRPSVAWPLPCSFQKYNDNKLRAWFSGQQPMVEVRFVNCDSLASPYLYIFKRPTSLQAKFCRGGSNTSQYILIADSCIVSRSLHATCSLVFANPASRLCLPDVTIKADAFFMRVCAPNLLWEQEAFHRRIEQIMASSKRVVFLRVIGTPSLGRVLKFFQMLNIS